MNNIRQFSDKEKVRIRNLLFEKGKEYFSKFGIKKTSVEELTKSSGIAKGSFYSFFGSKEELYFAILMNEIKDAIDINRLSLSSDLSPKQIMKEMLHNSVHIMSTNPILNIMLIPEEYELVYRRIADDNNDNAMEIIKPLIFLLSKWKTEGRIIDKDPILLANVVKCLFLLTTHKKEIGINIYDEVIDFLIEMISEKFTIV